MFEVRVDGDGIIYLTGRLDATQVDKAEAAIAARNGSIVVDLSQLDYIASAGISVLLRAYKRLDDSGATMKLAHVSPRILTVFQFAGLDRIFVIEP